MNKILIKNLLALLVLGTLGSFLICVIIGLMIYAPAFRCVVIFIIFFTTLMWSIYRVALMQSDWSFQCGKKSLKKVLTEAD